tara:strand:- start:1327 stop:1485 length:159 start_codon:yes stop_codon:yes gene_type:complete
MEQQKFQLLTASGVSQHATSDHIPDVGNMVELSSISDQWSRLSISDKEQVYA